MTIKTLGLGSGESGKYMDWHSEYDSRFRKAIGLHHPDRSRSRTGYGSPDGEAGVTS